MALVPVYRGPTMTGPQIEYHYFRDTETGERFPVSYRTLPSQEWITNEVLVETVFAELFARDAAYARAQEALGPMFLGEEGQDQGATRVDDGSVVTLLLPAVAQTERWLEVAVGLVDKVPDEITAGTIAVEWVS